MTQVLGEAAAQAARNNLDSTGRISPVETTSDHEETPEKSHDKNCWMINFNSFQVLNLHLSEQLERFECDSKYLEMGYVNPPKNEAWLGNLIYQWNLKFYPHLSST